MKSITTILLSLIYLAVSCGIVVNSHYCMGKLSGISYHATEQSSQCGKCGMDKSGCCHDHIQVLQLDNVQNSVAQVEYKLPALKPILQAHPYIETNSLLKSSIITRLQSDAPPGVNTQSLAVLYCVFRI